MTIHFPLTGALHRDFDLISGALTKRSEQIKMSHESQSLLKRVTKIALDALGLTAAVVGIACVPASLIVFSTTFIPLAAASLAISITCLILHKLMTPRSDGEQIIRNQWKALVESLKEGKGTKILATGQELAKQKEKRQQAFMQCITPLPPENTTPFLQKVCVIGYLQIAMESLREGKEELAVSNAYLALSHFGTSGFLSDIGNFLQTVAKSPKVIRQLIETHQVGEDLRALDRLIVLSLKLDSRGE